MACLFEVQKSRKSREIAFSGAKSRKNHAEITLLRTSDIAQNSGKFSKSRTSRTQSHKNHTNMQHMCTVTHTHPCSHINLGRGGATLAVSRDSRLYLALTLSRPRRVLHTARRIVSRHRPKPLSCWYCTATATGIVSKDMKRPHTLSELSITGAKKRRIHNPPGSTADLNLRWEGPPHISPCGEGRGLLHHGVLSHG